jgi:hypothetical protein
VKPATTRAKRKSTKQETVDFSFASDAPRYAKKNEYVANNLSFTITAVEFEPKRGFGGADRWAIQVAPDDKRAPEIITLPTNEKRNAQLQAAKVRVETKGPIPNVRLVKANGTFYFRPAEPRGS